MGLTKMTPCSYKMSVFISVMYEKNNGVILCKFKMLQLFFFARRDFSQAGQYLPSLPSSRNGMFPIMSIPSLFSGLFYPIFFNILRPFVGGR